MKCRYCILIVLLFLCTGRGQEAVGQVELIVRPADDASDLQEALRDPAAKSAEYGALFENVRSVQSVFATSAAKSSAAIPAFVVSVPDSSSWRALRERWERRSEVRYVQPNVVYQLDAAARSIADDPLADSLGHLDVIRAREAWSITTGDPSVRIGMIDTGVLLDHPDLAGQFWSNPDETANGRDDDGNGLVDDITGYDFVDRPEEVESGDYRERDADPSPDLKSPFSGHGTLVAGVMSAARDNDVGIAGVAPGAHLVPLRAFAGDGRGATDDIAAAIVYAADLGLDVVNLSFGRDYAAPLLREAIQYAVNRGTVVVASGGNNGGDDPHYPSDYPEVISVAWLNSDGTDIAFRGEYGVGIDLGAPGTAIYTTIQPPANSEAQPAVERFYGRRSGSSVAAPMVTGAVALLRSIAPDLTPESVQSILTASAVDLREPGWDHRTAAGRLDVATALSQALPARTEITHPAHDGGTAASSTPVIGSAVDPSFESFSVYMAEGTDELGDRVDPWTRIAGPIRLQAYRDTLAQWDTGALAEGAYTLRLVTTLRDGGAVEDRRRVFVDRSPPRLTPKLLSAGLVEGRWGLTADVVTDDPTSMTMEVTRDGVTRTITSEVFNARHGLTWRDAQASGGTVQVRLTAKNAAGLTAEMDTALAIPASQINTALFTDEALSVPHGYALRTPTDLDNDGLLELLFNQYENGSVGDTLRAYEWDGSGFSRVGGLLANVILRDVGDSNGNGRQELLAQRGGETLVLEQAEGAAFPSALIFQDTTGLRNPDAENAVWGARLTDLDGDGRGEIFAHNQQVWRVLEYDGTQYQEVARLDNPTSADGADELIDANRFQEPEAAIADFDGDGRMNALVGDSDGDWVMYEARGDNAFEVVWTYETDRINAGTRFAVGDFDGDGDLDFVTYVENLKILRSDGRREPPLGLYYFWRTTGDDQFELMRRIPVSGNVSRNGSLRAGDFDGDGADELALAHPPNLYVLEPSDQQAWQPQFHQGPVRPGGTRTRSIMMVAGDFSGNGRDDLIAGAVDQRFHRYALSGASPDRRPPLWTTAFARDDRTVVLSWQAPQADSVTVFQGAPDGPLNPRLTTTESPIELTEEQRQRFALRAWQGGNASPLSDTRTIRPHAPAVLTKAAASDSQTVRLTFSGSLAPDTDVRQFRLDERTHPSSLLLGSGGQTAVLQFDDAPEPGPQRIRWTGVTDAEGTPVATTSTEVVFPDSPAPALILDTWEVLDTRRVVLTFSAPLDPATARDASNYRLEPVGEVANVQFDAQTPAQVTLDVEGVAIGPVGRTVSLEVTHMQGVGGESLGEEGAVVRLVQPASGLDEVYVYPNPYRAHQHGEQLTVAGLPPEATVRIVSAQGILIRVLNETNRDGGVEWDLRDRRGRRVPSGIYLIRVEAPNQSSILKKAAIIR